MSPEQPSSAAKDPLPGDMDTGDREYPDRGRQCTDGAAPARADAEPPASWL